MVPSTQQLAECFRDPVEARWALDGAVIDHASRDVLAVGGNRAPVDDLPHLLDAGRFQDIPGADDVGVKGARGVVLRRQRKHSAQVKDPVDCIALDGIHHDGKVCDASRLEDEPVALPRQRSMKRRNVEDDGFLPFIHKEFCQAGSNEAGSPCYHRSHI